MQPRIQSFIKNTLALFSRFEDGTLPFLSIISLQHGMDALSIVSLADISKHVFSLARYLNHSLMTLHHCNDKPAAKIYCDTDYEDQNLQGGIVTFNLLRSSGEFVGYMEVVHMAALFKIYLRTGCFCNPGACQRHLGLSNEDVMKNYDSGYTCGGSRDLIDGKPTGAVRISFGYMSTPEDVEAVLRMIKKCFIDGPEIVRTPEWLPYFAVSLNEKYCYNRSAGVGKTNGEIRDDKFGTQQNGIKVKQTEQNIVCDIGKDIKALENHDIRNDKSEKVEKMTLARLFIYPVKSCAAYEITDSWLLAERGLQYDREWMIVTSAGVCLSQKQQVNLCLLQPKICKEENILMLNYPGKNRK